MKFTPLTLEHPFHQHPGPVPSRLYWMIEKCRQFKTAWAFWFGPFRPKVICLHPRTVKVITLTSSPKALSSFGGYAALIKWLGNWFNAKSSDAMFQQMPFSSLAFGFFPPKLQSCIALVLRVYVSLATNQLLGVCLNSL